MINKTIVSTLCLTAIIITLILVQAEVYLTLVTLGVLASVNGVSIWKANHQPK